MGLTYEVTITVTNNKLFPFNWLPQRVGLFPYFCLWVVLGVSFHSTDCPSEWGICIAVVMAWICHYTVSIQLIAPASGALKSKQFHQGAKPWLVSIQLIAPASGAKVYKACKLEGLQDVSIQLIAPASGALTGLSESYPLLFPFNWLPQRVGLCLKPTENYSIYNNVSIQLIAPASGAKISPQSC